jgi:tRNA uridine 5-carboxymethylaminomethyl modification enzyme
MGLIGGERWGRYEAKDGAIAKGRQIMQSTRIEGKTIWELLSRPHTALADLVAKMGAGQVDRAYLPDPAPEVGQACPTYVAVLQSLMQAEPLGMGSLVIDAQYDGYLQKERASLAHMQDLDAKLIPGDVDYWSVPHLRHEAREKLSAIHPRSLGQALRISGVTPADVTVLAIHLHRGR